MRRPFDGIACGAFLNHPYLGGRGLEANGFVMQIRRREQPASFRNLIALL